tara:strand:+ start:1027 stop:4458 length:3432 start_codon:yes stop_codon:yes gene_type:complete
MARFRSGRVSHQHIGISSFTDEKLVLGVIGNVNISNDTNISGILTVGQQLDAPNITVTGAGSSITVDDINARNLIVSGIATFNGRIGAGDSLGSPGQYLKCTEDGVTWASFGGVRDSILHTATAGQTTFTGFTYNPFFTDVYVNGVKLVNSEYSAPGGNTITIYSPCFEGDVVEFISFNVDSLTNGQAGGGSALGINTTGTSLFNNIDAVGVITAFQFHGDGSNLTGINTTSTYAEVSGISTLSEGLTGSPNIVVGVITATEYRGNGQYLEGIISGIEFQNEGTTVGTAGTVNFVGNGVTAHYDAASGISTINIGHYSNAAGIATVAVNAQGLIGSPNITVSDIVANNVSVVQTLTYEDVTNVDSVGLVTARSGLRVHSNGINVAAGIVTSANGFEGNITGDCYGNADTATVALNLTGSPHINVTGIVASGGINVSGLVTATTFVGNLVGSVVGGNVNAYNGTFSNDVTANKFYGDGSNLDGIVTTNDTPPASPTDGALWWKSDEGILKIYYTDVDSSQWVDASPGSGGGGSGGGGTDLINDATPQLGGDLDLNNYNISGTGNISATGTLDIGGRVNAGNIFSSGIVTATNFYGDIVGNVTGNIVGNVTGTLNTSGISTVGSLDANGPADISGSIVVGGHTNLGNVSMSGVATATEFHGDGQYLTNIYSAPPQGISTTGFTGLTDLYCAGTLEVDGQSILDDVIVSSASTFQGPVNANTGPVILNNTTLNGLSIFTGLSTFVDIDVDGLTELDDLNVTGVSTFSSVIDANAGVLANTLKVEDLTATRVVFSGTGGEIEDSSNLTFDGTTLSADSFAGDGSNLTNVTNSALANSTIGLGGVNLVLGQSYNTPGLNLSNAINYPYTSLTGITTDLLGDTSPQLGGNLDVNNKNIEIGDCTTSGSDNTLKIGSNGLEIHHRPGAFATYIQNKNKDTNLWITGQNTSGIWGNIFIRPYLNAFSGVACWWGGATELYYGNTGAKKLETTSGGVTITGTLSKSGGSFKIPHPVAGLSTTKHLVHSFLEGPQMDLIYRGKIDLVDGTATVNIDTKAGMTEGTFVLLNRDIQCFTSNETGWTAVKGSVSGNILTITAQDNTCTDTISWMVVGERQDDTVKSLDMTDSEGNLIVEPDQPAPDTKHADIQAQL